MIENNKRTGSDLSPLTIVVLVAYFSVLAFAGFWARGTAAEVPGPTTIKYLSTGDVYVQVGTALFRVEPDGTAVQDYDLSRLGADRVFDFVPLQGERVLLRLGEYKKGLLDQIAMFLRLPGAPMEAARRAREGFFICDLGKSECEEFGGKYDNRDVHWLAYDASARTLYISDSSRHALHKVTAAGEITKSQNKEFIFPNQLTWAGDDLLVVDTNNKKIKQISTRDRDFGELIQQYDPIVRSVRGAGHSWPYMMIGVHDEYWVLVMRNSMSHGGIYRYSKANWRYLGRVEVPDLQDAGYLARVGDEVWISDYEGMRIARTSLGGEFSGYASSPGLDQKLRDNARKKQQWSSYATAILNLFAISVVVGLVIAMRMELRRSDRLFQQQAALVAVDLANPSIVWLERNPAFRRVIILTGIILLLLMVLSGASMVSLMVATEKSTSWQPVAMPFVFLILGGVLLYAVLLRHRIGILGDVLILAKGKKYRAARGKNIIYSGNFVAIDNMAVSLGNGSMPLFTMTEVVKHLHPVVQQATVVTQQEMQSYQMRIMSGFTKTVVTLFSLVTVIFVIYLINS